jgi:hypothetical protein
MSSCCEPSPAEGFSKGVAVGLPEYFGGAGGGGGGIAGGAPPEGGGRDGGAPAEGGGSLLGGGDRMEGVPAL